MRNNKISVVMSVYNGEAFLESSVKSVLNQSFKDFELIIMDDCSTDGSLEILLSMAKIDSRIRIVRNENNFGLAKSLNIGIQLAKHEYIARMDADDICMPNRLEDQISYMIENKNIDILYADTLLIDIATQVICPSWRPSKVENVLNNLEKHNFIPHPTVMFKKNVFLSVGGYDESFRTAQDLNLWLRMREKGCCFGYLNKIVLMYRLNPASVRAYIKDYWFSVANYCVWNGRKLKAFKYFPHITLKQKLIIFVKILLPFSYYKDKYK